jgi:hypothetical protein
VLTTSRTRKIATVFALAIAALGSDCPEKRGDTASENTALGYTACTGLNSVNYGCSVYPVGKGNCSNGRERGFSSREDACRATEDDATCKADIHGC